MKKKVIVRAPILTQSGYGEHARFIMRALKAKEEYFDIYAIPIEWGKLNWECCYIGYESTVSVNGDYNISSLIRWLSII